jgi:hypothetical protein
MKHYLMTLGFDVWSALKNGYIAPTTPLVDTVGKRLSENKSKAMSTILNGLEDS